MEKLIFIGDIHGNLNVIRSLALNNPDSYLIQVGDFGIGFYNKDNENIRLDELNDLLASTNCILYVIRGNHDDPKYFDGTIVRTNIELLADYSCRNILGHNILFVGGAMSIDRKYRRMHNLGWWENEKFVLLPHQLNILPSIDIVVTHTAPTFCAPVGINNLVRQFAANDFTLISELNTERLLVDRLFELLAEVGSTPHIHFYGHFHMSNVDVIEDTKHICLDIDSTYTLLPK
jgi:predicted phosphodiesterase